MTHDPTRRALLAVTAPIAADFVVAPFVRTAQAQEVPGPIEAAHPEYVRLMEEWDARCLVTWKAEDRYDEPPRPVYRLGVSEGGFRTIPTSQNRCRVVLDDREENITLLRAMIGEPCPDDVDPLWHAQRRESAGQTLDEIMTWKAECKKRRDHAGLTEAEEAEEAARSAATARIEATFATEAATFRELAFQAANLREDWDEERANAVIIRLVELAGIKPRPLPA